MQDSLIKIQDLSDEDTLQPISFSLYHFQQPTTPKEVIRVTYCFFLQYAIGVRLYLPLEYQHSKLLEIKTFIKSPYSKPTIDSTNNPSIEISSKSAINTPTIDPMIVPTSNKTFHIIKLLEHLKLLKLPIFCSLFNI